MLFYYLSLRGISVLCLPFKWFKHSYSLPLLTLLLNLFMPKCQDLHFPTLPPRNSQSSQSTQRTQIFLKSLLENIDMPYSFSLSMFVRSLMRLLNMLNVSLSRANILFLYKSNFWPSLKKSQIHINRFHYILIFNICILLLHS